MAEAKVKRKKMSKEEKEQWDKLYFYVHDVIMGYDEKTALDRYFVLRLKGLKEGKFIANNKTKLYGEYTFQEILATFMYCKSEIVKGLTFNDFKDNQHKINYIMFLVELQLNMIRERIRNKAKEEKQIEQIEVAEQSKIKYVNKKDKKKKPNKLLEGIE